MSDCSRGGGTFGSTLRGRVAFTASNPTIFVADGPAAADLTFAGQLIATNGFTKTGAGNLVLADNNNGLLGGTVTLNAGVLTASAIGALGSSIIELSGGVLQASVALNNTVRFGAGGGTFDVPAGSTAVFSSALTGTASIALTKSGGGTLALQANNGFTGDLKLNAGTLRFNNDNNLGNPANRIQLTGGVLQYAGATPLAFSRPMTLTSGGIDVIDPAAALTLTGNLTGVQVGTVTSGWSIDKTGPGALFVQPPSLGAEPITFNARGGSLSVNAPGLIASGALNANRSYGVFGAATLIVAGGPIIANAANITLSGVNSRFDQLNTLQSNGGNLALLSGRVFATAGNLTNTGVVSMGGAGMGDAGSSIIVNGTFTNSSTVRVSDQAILRVNGELLNSGSIDLGAALVIDYTGPSPLSLIRGQIIAGYNNGAWNGPGILSSRAAASIAVADAVGYAQASLLSQPVRDELGITDATALVARYTLVADANLDGAVSLDDFTALAAAFGTPSIWSSGDFNYDGVTNLDDFTPLAANFGNTLTALNAPASAITLPRAATVPEPLTAAILLPLALGSRHRKRR